MSHPVLVHPFVVMTNGVTNFKTETLTIGKLFSPDSLFIVHLVVDCIELFSDILQFL